MPLPMYIYGPPHVQQHGKEMLVHIFLSNAKKGGSVKSGYSDDADTVYVSVPHGPLNDVDGPVMAPGGKTSGDGVADVVRDPASWRGSSWRSRSPSALAGSRKL